VRVETVVIAIVVVVASVAAAALAYEGLKDGPPGPASPRPPPPGVVPIVWAPQFVGGSPLSLLQGPLLPYIYSGDSVMLSSGASVNQTPPDDSQLNHYLSELEPVLPAGVIYEARTGGTSNVAALAAGVSHSFTSLVYDYEPGFEPEFTYNFSKTMVAFENFSRIAHDAGFGAIGYPFSAPAWHANASSYGWNFGQLDARSGVDSLQVQLQGAAHQGESTWQLGVQALLAQYADYGLPPSALSVQITIAEGDPNNVSVADAYADYQYATEQGVGQIVLWFNSGTLQDVLQFLQDIR
jgi:hypothetical protein